MTKETFEEILYTLGEYFLNHNKIPFEGGQFHVGSIIEKQLIGKMRSISTWTRISKQVQKSYQSLINSQVYSMADSNNSLQASIGLVVPLLHNRGALEQLRPAVISSLELESEQQLYDAFGEYLLNKYDNFLLVENIYLSKKTFVDAKDYFGFGNVDKQWSSFVDVLIERFENVDMSDPVIYTVKKSQHIHWCGLWMLFEYFGCVVELLTFYQQYQSMMNDNSLGKSLRKDSLGLPPVLQSPSPSQQLVAPAPNNAIPDDEVVKVKSLLNALSRLSGNHIDQAATSSRITGSSQLSGQSVDRIPYLLTSLKDGHIDLLIDALHNHDQDQAIVNQCSNLFFPLGTEFVEFVLNSSLSKVRSFTVGVSSLVTEHFRQMDDGGFHEYWRDIIKSQFYRYFDKLSDYLAFRCMFVTQRLTSVQMFALTVVCISVAFVQLHNSLLGRTSLTIQEIQESFKLYEIIMQQDRQWIESIEYLPISDFGKKMLGIRVD
ncbi:hypothetical protein MIR68_010300 [Amoeboaphelidium protococcarum]|nr:hypothetical protein MIR68_010300 [Amoeboaphelidium protococcarum]